MHASQASPTPGLNDRTPLGAAIQSSGTHPEKNQCLAVRLRAFQARSERYQALGYDRTEAARFVVRAAGGLFGPALDVGTGQGLCALALAGAGLSVVSVDPDAEAQALAQGLARAAGLDSSIQFIQTDMAFLRYPEGYFRCAAMMDVLHHLEHPGPVLRQIARMVKKDSIFVVADFDEPGFELVARVHREEGRAHPRTEITMEHALGMLEQVGFRVLGSTRGHFHRVEVLVKEHG